MASVVVNSGFVGAGEKCQHEHWQLPMQIVGVQEKGPLGSRFQLHTANVQSADGAEVGSFGSYVQAHARAVLGKLPLSSFPLHVTKHLVRQPTGIVVDTEKCLFILPQENSEICVLCGLKSDQDVTALLEQYPELSFLMSTQNCSAFLPVVPGKAAQLIKQIVEASQSNREYVVGSLLRKPDINTPQDKLFRRLCRNASFEYGAPALLISLVMEPCILKKGKQVVGLPRGCPFMLVPVDGTCLEVVSVGDKVNSEETMSKLNLNLANCADLQVILKPDLNLPSGACVAQIRDERDQNGYVFAVPGEKGRYIVSTKSSSEGANYFAAEMRVLFCLGDSVIVTKNVSRRAVVFSAGGCVVIPAAYGISEVEGRFLSIILSRNAWGDAVLPAHGFHQADQELESAAGRCVVCSPGQCKCDRSGVCVEEVQEC